MSLIEENFLKAIKDGNIKEAIQILDHEQNSIDKTVMHEAAQLATIEGYYNIFKRLVKELNTYGIKKNDNEFLINATKHGRLDFLKAFKNDNSRVDLKSVMYDGYQLTHIAASGGHYEVFQWLVKEQGCDMNATNNKGLTPLSIAVEKGQLAFIKAFNTKNPEFDLRIILSKAIEYKKTEILKFLIIGGVELLNFKTRVNGFIDEFEKVINVDKLINSGLLADNIYDNNQSSAEELLQQNNDFDFFVVIERLISLCKQNGIPYGILDRKYLLQELKKLIIERINNIKTPEAYINDQIEVHVADLNYCLDKVKFPCKRPYSSLIKKFSNERPDVYKILINRLEEQKVNESAPYYEFINDINNILKSDQNKRLIKDEIEVVTSIISYNLEPHYQPYNFFLYIIDPENRQDILDVFLKYSWQADLIFESLKDVVLDSKNLNNLKNLRKEYSSPSPLVFKRLYCEQQKIIESQEVIIAKHEAHIEENKRKITALKSLVDRVEAKINNLESENSKLLGVGLEKGNFSEKIRNKQTDIRGFLLPKQERSNKRHRVSFVEEVTQNENKIARIDNVKGL